MISLIMKMPGSLITWDYLSIYPSMT